MENEDNDENLEVESQDGIYDIPVEKRKIFYEGSDPTVKDLCDRGFAQKPRPAQKVGILIPKK